MISVYLYTYLLLRKEVIQPHLPIRLPCYDFTPIINPTFGRALLAVRLRTSGVTDSHGAVSYTHLDVYKRQNKLCSLVCLFYCVGTDLFFQDVAIQVFSALVSLTSVFGMGTGGPSPSLAPTILFSFPLVTRRGIEPLFAA